MWQFGQEEAIGGLRFIDYRRRHLALEDSTGKGAAPKRSDQRKGHKQRKSFSHGSIILRFQGEITVKGGDSIMSIEMQLIGHPSCIKAFSSRPLFGPASL
jgi:hypothetical protein